MLWDDYCKAYEDGCITADELMRQAYLCFSGYELDKVLAEVTLIQEDMVIEAVDSIEVTAVDELSF